MVACLAKPVIHLFLDFLDSCYFCTWLLTPVRYSLCNMMSLFDINETNYLSKRELYFSFLNHDLWVMKILVPFTLSMKKSASLRISLLSSNPLYSKHITKSYKKKLWFLKSSMLKKHLIELMCLCGTEIESFRILVATVQRGYQYIHSFLKSLN